MAPLDALHSQVFRVLPELPRAQVVTDRLIRAVQIGLLRSGERLPPESEMAERFGVSQLTVRSALDELRKRRMVTTRRGRSGGTFVLPPASPVSETSETSAGQLAQYSVSDLRDLGDEAAALLFAAVRLTIDRALPGEIARIEALMAALPEARNSAARVKADSRFHLEFAVAAQSERLLATGIRNRSEIALPLWAPPAGDREAEQAHFEHRAILDAVLAEDQAAAFEAVGRHIRTETSRLVAARLDRAGDDAAAVSRFVRLGESARGGASATVDNPTRARGAVHTSQSGHRTRLTQATDPTHRIVSARVAESVGATSTM